MVLVSSLQPEEQSAWSDTCVGLSASVSPLPPPASAASLLLLLQGEHFLCVVVGGTAWDAGLGGCSCLPGGDEAPDVPGPSCVCWHRLLAPLHGPGSPGCSVAAFLSPGLCAGGCRERACAGLSHSKHHHGRDGTGSAGTSASGLTPDSSAVALERVQSPVLLLVPWQGPPCHARAPRCSASAE